MEDEVISFSLAWCF